VVRSQPPAGVYYTKTNSVCGIAWQGFFLRSLQVLAARTGLTRRASTLLAVLLGWASDSLLCLGHHIVAVLHDRLIFCHHPLLVLVCFRLPLSAKTTAAVAVMAKDAEAPTWLRKASLLQKRGVPRGVPFRASSACKPAPVTLRFCAGHRHLATASFVAA
jgi:hypothetical protein